MHEADIDDNGAASVSSEEEIKCGKLEIPGYITAYLEKRELNRQLRPLLCDNNLLENITTNYVIVKKIISNLTWQDKLICKHVCSMWYSAVRALQKEQNYPVDFSINLRFNCIKNGIKFVKSSNFYTEPLAVLVFSNSPGFVTTSKCESIVPSPCEPLGCEKEHYLVDMIQQKVAGPKHCMVTVKACNVSYLPLYHSITYKNALRHKTFVEPDPFIGGICIPIIPNVKFTILRIKSMNSIKEDFYNKVDKLVETQCIKGVFALANDNYLLHSVEDIIFLNYFKTVQPNIPYALGGCLIEDSVCEPCEVTEAVNVINLGQDFISESLIAVGVFTIPKDIQEDQASNFAMYSLVLQSSDWTKAKIQSTINEFSRNITNYEHSVAIKLSCVGRSQKHELEQQYFRSAFPNTRLIGCYGNGELGLNHPARTITEEVPRPVKRHCQDPGPQYGLMYSYSTVFVYIGWGKIVSVPNST